MSRLFAVALLLTAAALGCGTAGQYPVAGRIVDQAGQPIEGIEGAQVVFSQVDGPTSSVGDVKADGSFEMFTMKEGDGVPPGDYQVTIARKYLDPEHPAPQVIASKYERIDDSGLTAKVEPKSNTFEFKVERVAARAK